METGLLSGTAAGDHLRRRRFPRLPGAVNQRKQVITGSRRQPCPRDEPFGKDERQLPGDQIRAVNTDASDGARAASERLPGPARLRSTQLQRSDRGPDLNTVKSRTEAMVADSSKTIATPPDCRTRAHPGPASAPGRHGAVLGPRSSLPIGWRRASHRARIRATVAPIHRGR